MKPLLVVGLLVACVGWAPGDAGAQELADPIVHGRVLLGDTAAHTGMVVLHRVSADSQGEVDSVRVGSDGSFSLRLPAVPSPDRSEVYFASVRYSGIVYFGQPVTIAVQLDSLYEINTYDTAMVAMEGQALPVGDREIFLQASQTQAWDAVDLFQVTNDGLRTLVAQEGGVVWSYPLPEGAQDATISDMGLGVGAAEVRDGRLVVTAPIPPGQRMYVVRYALPDPFITVPLPELTDVLEILVREPAPPMEAVGLTAFDRVELEAGSTYLRFGGTELSGQVVRLIAGKEASAPPVGWLSFVLALALTAVGVWAVQSGAPRQPAAVPPPVGRREMMLEVVRLDEEFESLSHPTTEERGLYEARRRDLVRRIRSLA